MPAGPILQGFARPLLFVMVIGAYSPLFLVASLVADWEMKSPAKRRK
jgi:preprotein translocase subunit SecF